MTDATTVASSKKPRLVNRYFIDSTGEKHSRAIADAVKVVHEWKDREDLRLEMDLTSLSAEQKICAIAFGISQVVGNAYGGETDPDEAFEKGQARWETIVGGNWATERVIGDRTSDLVEAFAKAYQDAGKDFSDDKKRELQEKLDSGALDPKALRADPRIRAALDAIKAKRASERAAKSAEALKSSGADLPSF